MALIPWRPRRDVRHPFGEMESLQHEMNRLFDFSLGRWPDRSMGLMEGVWSPSVDVFDSKDAVLVKADMPGMKKEDVDISVHGNTLIIKGEKKDTARSEERGYVKTERFYGSFNRALTLPAEVDAAKVKASYKNGVLEIMLPKKEEQKPKQIKIDIE